MTIRTHIGVRLTVVRLFGVVETNRVIASVYYIREKFENRTPCGALSQTSAKDAVNQYSATSKSVYFFFAGDVDRAVNYEFEVGLSTSKFESRSCRTPAWTPVNMSKPSTRED